MFTKNFNSKVKAVFNKSTAIISATDSIIASSLVKFGQFSFNLSELYARKFRKSIFEKKKTFSEVTLFQIIYNDLSVELNSENARVSKLTDLGQKSNLLLIENQKILDQIKKLSDFCIDCNTKKIIKRRKKK